MPITTDGRSLRYSETLTTE